MADPVQADAGLLRRAAVLLNAEIVRTNHSRDPWRIQYAGRQLWFSDVPYDDPLACRTKADAEALLCRLRTACAATILDGLT